MSRCGAECQSSEDCPTALTNGVCNYDGSCSEQTCSCDYQSEPCPPPGTVINGTCYYGTTDCTDNGCTDLTGEMGCKDTCDQTRGPIDTSGPTISDMGVQPNPAGPYCSNTITATATEECTHIAAAEYYVATWNNQNICQPEANLPYGAMSASDGSFDELIENVTSSLNVLGLQDGGNYKYCVRAQNDDGVWSTCECRRLEIDNKHPNLIQDSINGSHWADQYGSWVCADNFTYSAYFCDQDDQSCISAAEYFVKPPQNWDWPAGTGNPMLPTDGSFGQPETTCDWTYSVVMNGQFVEGTHEIKSEALDCACNWGKLIYQGSRKVVLDRTPPVITKTVSDPRYECGYYGDEQEANECWYVNSSTTLTFNTHDVDNAWDHVYSNSPTIHYRYRYKINYTDSWGEWSNWVTVNSNATSFSFNEDSIHEVEYYAEDRCGNPSAHIFEIDIVDSRPPVTTKEVGEPKVACSDDNPTGCDYYITQQTPITLTCIDQEPHPIDQVSLHYRYKINDGEYTDWMTYEGTIRFQEDSKHTLQYYCVDGLGNREATHTEIDVVDTQPPNMTKEVGEPKIPCEPVNDKTVRPECDYFMTTQTPITLSCMDMDPHPVGGVTLFYKWVLNGNSSEWFNTTDGSVTFSYPTDSEHWLYYYCTDALGNEVRDEELDIVDTQPPETTKTLGNPKVACSEEDPNDCDYYINQDTTIQLDCTDTQPHPVGADYIKYRYKINDGNFSEWMLYEGEFSFQEDSRHTLEYYCVDRLNNTEQVKTEVDVVDTLPPVVTKEVSEPKVACSEDDPTGCDYWLTQESMISLNCEDQQPHPVDNVTLFYRYGLDQQPDGRWLVYDGPFNYTEDSVHYLEYYCEDALGNRGDTYTEVDRVDSTPPTTIKTYGDPVFFDGYTRWITSLTPVTLNATDGGEICASGVNKTYWRNTMVEDGYCWNSYMPNKGDSIYNCQEAEGSGEWSTYTEPFYKNETSCHLIEYYSVDNLGNTEPMKKQCVFIDNEGPSLVKLVGDPKIACEQSEPGGCDGEGITYTTNADFDSGTLVGLEHTTVPNQLQISFTETSTYPVMWIANAGEDSVSKWDTNTNKEVARYHTWFGALANHGDWDGPAPSRTAVDSDGNVYVGNRHFDGLPADVIKIYTNDWVDRNGNGVMDTSFDANNDSAISEPEMLQMVDSNFNNHIDPNEITDERIAWVTSVGTNNCWGRSLAIDLNGDIWLGCYNEQAYYKVDGQTGALLLGPIYTVGHTPYGALVDKNGILWGASLGTNLLRLDTNTNAVTTFSHGQYGSNYGIAIGYDASENTQVYLASQSGYSYIQFDSSTSTFSVPADVYIQTLGVATDRNGNIVVANYGTGAPTKFAPDGTVIWSVPTQLNSEGRGVVVDSNNDVWVVHRASDRIVKYSGTDGAPLGIYVTGRGPYTYSDAAGLGFSASIAVGTWNVVYDGGSSGLALGPVSWNDLTPEGTSITVKVRSSEDASSWSSWETVTNGGAFAATPNGRYLEVQATLRGESEISPILYDLTVAGGCSPTPNECDYWITQQTSIEFNCTDEGPHPVDQAKTYFRYSVDGGEFTNWTLYEEPIYFQEDSKHTIEYYCEDALGNSNGTMLVPHSEIDKVDSTPPTTIKTYGVPTVVDGPTRWITSQTPIDLSATDGGQICAVGVNKTYYNWTRVSDEFCYRGCEIDEADKLIPQMEWAEYTQPFAISEDSCHMITYFSVDLLNNVEVIKRQCTFVDNLPPVTTKTVGEPKIACSQDDPTGCDYWITNTTQISLSCEDQQPHPVSNVSIHYRYSVDGANPTEWMVYNGPFTYSEDSVHYLEYYCSDELGNTEAVKNETDKVDSTPPVTTKELMGCYTPCTQGEECHYWINKHTKIGFTAVDGGEICASGVDYTRYKRKFDGFPWGPWTTYNPSNNLTFYLEGYYYLKYKSADLLGNVEQEQYEVDIVDNTPPRGWVLNPVSGRYYHDGETFTVLAPAADYGDPASGVQACEFSAIRINFEELSEYELLHVRNLIRSGDLDDLLEYLNGRYTIVQLGSVPFVNGYCQGTLTVPTPSNIPDKAYLMIKVRDRSCNEYYELARDFADGDAILMDFDNSAPHVVITDHDGLDGIVEAGHHFTVYASIEEYDSGADDCWGELYKEIPVCGVTQVSTSVETCGQQDLTFGNNCITECNGDEECESGCQLMEQSAICTTEEVITEEPECNYTLEFVTDYSGTLLSDTQCRVTGDVPDDSQDGTYRLVVAARDEEFNIGNDSVRFAIDGTPPVKTLYSPVNGEYYGIEGLPVKIGMVDSTGVAPETVQYRVYQPGVDLDALFSTGGLYDSGWLSTELTEGNALDGNYTDQFDILGENITSGTYFMRVRGCDVLYAPPLPSGSAIPEHCSDPILTIIIDLDPPVGPTSVYISSTQISWAAATDALSGVNHYNIYDGDAKIGETNSLSYTVGDSTHTYYVSAVDNAGNEGQKVLAIVGTAPPANNGNGGSGSGGGSYSGGSSGSRGGGAGSAVSTSSDSSVSATCQQLGSICSEKSDCCEGDCTSGTCTVESAPAGPDPIDVKAPEYVEVGSAVTVRATHRVDNSPLVDADLYIIGPDGEVIKAKTNGNGEVSFTAKLSGWYKYEVPGKAKGSITFTYSQPASASSGTEELAPPKASTPTAGAIQSTTGMVFGGLAPLTLGILLLLLIALGYGAYRWFNKEG
jgi:hypothetical protein